MASRTLPPVWLFLTLGVVVVGAFGWLTYDQFRNDSALSERGVETQAQVTDVGSKGRVTVVFTTADGRRVETLIGQGDTVDGTRAGETVPIVYDPSRPADEVRDSRVPENHHVAYISLAATVFGAVGIPLAAWHLAREHRRRALIP
ncbi:hypothetical protein ACTI_48950 [Actinoplanes sp. OR16]|uniref:DUF3592 domain-containing protein n=1 Tax=Actinoplanes sp. OR16 TaxID=946334 RepID=UPI000F6F390E|nr:DUF3592 domain-containing protein [Actinoplanes sp. OR16]BBH68210.1 hypothetical protein ACTI_48950 [Actinoplanes sp. OR16]